MNGEKEKIKKTEASDKRVKEDTGKKIKSSKAQKKALSVEEKLRLEIEKLKKEINYAKAASAKIINEYNSNSNYLQEQYKSDYKYRSQSLMEDLLRNLDIFQMALVNKDNLNPEMQKWLIGFEMVYKGILETLTREGLNKINVKIGDTFDSEIHQVVDKVSDKNRKHKEIIEIKGTGYRLHDRLISPTSVIVNYLKKDEKENNKKEEKERGK